MENLLKRLRTDNSTLIVFYKSSAIWHLSSTNKQTNNMPVRPSLFHDSKQQDVQSNGMLQLVCKSSSLLCWLNYQWFSHPTRVDRNFGSLYPNPYSSQRSHFLSPIGIQHPSDSQKNLKTRFKMKKMSRRPTPPSSCIICFHESDIMGLNHGNNRVMQDTGLITSS